MKEVFPKTIEGTLELVASAYNALKVRDDCDFYTGQISDEAIEVVANLVIESTLG